MILANPRDVHDPELHFLQEPEASSHPNAFVGPSPYIPAIRANTRVSLHKVTQRDFVVANDLVAGVFVVHILESLATGHHPRLCRLRSLYPVAS